MSAVQGGRSRQSRVRAAILAAAVAVLLPICRPPAAAADDHIAVFVGAQGSYSNYVYGGVTFALPGSTIGSGFALRALADIGGYNYISDPLGVVKANFSGGELDALYQFSHKNFWGDFGVGANYTYTNMTPYDVGNPLLGRQVELRLSTDGGTMSGPWRTDWTGFYGTRLQDYEARLGFTHQLSSVWRLGVEGYTEGNPNYHLNQIGPYVALDFTPRSELQFSTGWSWESGFQSRAYARASFYQRF